jgi:hypothetical protein
LKVIGVRSFSSCGLLTSICLPASVEHLSNQCFASCTALSSFTFEPGSQLTEIDEGVFAFCALLASFCVPRSVRQIGRRCFYECLSLSDVTFESPSNLETIGQQAFAGCNLLASLCLPASLPELPPDSLDGLKCLKSLAFEPGAKLDKIGESALTVLSGLESICVPASVEVLCKRCFHHLAQLSSVTFEPGSKLRELGAGVFAMCKSLKSIELPACVATIDHAAFMFSSLEGIAVAQGNPDFWASADSKCLYTSSGKLVRYFGLEEHVEIPKECSSIGTLCLGHLDMLSVAFEAGTVITRIESWACWGSLRLRSFVVPAGVEFMGQAVFRECRSLCEVKFECGSQLKEFAGQMFENCQALASICIPRLIDALPGRCFARCSSLTEVTFETGSKLTRVLRGAFLGCVSCTALQFPAELRFVEYGAFCGCTSLTQIGFDRPDGLRLLDLPPSDWGELRLPDSVQAIAGYCQRLEGRTRVVKFGTASRLQLARLYHIDANRMPQAGATAFLRFAEGTLRLRRIRLEGFVPEFIRDPSTDA